jgi:hypothetical protein
MCRGHGGDLSCSAKAENFLIISETLNFSRKSLRYAVMVLTPCNNRDLPATAPSGAYMYYTKQMLFVSLDEYQQTPLQTEHEMIPIEATRHKLTFRKFCSQLAPAARQGRDNSEYLGVGGSIRLKCISEL